MEIDERKLENFKVRNGVLHKYTGSGEIIVSIPDGVTEIDDAAFLGHREITSIRIPDSVKRIGQYAFVSCSSLKSIDIGSGVKNIPMGCFTGLIELEYVNLFDSIESIDDFAFRGCRSLKRIEFLSARQREPITSEEKGMAFEAMLLGKPYIITCVEKADTIPEIDRIGNYAFADCPSFDYHAIKEKTIQIGINAFDEVVEDFISSEPDSSIYKAEDDVFVESKKSDSEQVLFDGAANGSTSVKDEFQHENKTENNALVTDVHSGESEYIEDNPDHDNLTTEDDKQHTEYLVDGFTVKEDQILCLASGESVKDAPIAALGLSVRVYNCLNKAKAKVATHNHTEIMVSDVLCLSFEQLRNIQDLGTKSANEVLEKVQSYLLDGAGVETAGFVIGTSIVPGYSVIDGNITELETGLLVADVNVKNLGFGARLANGLRRRGIHYLSDLIQKTPNQLLGNYRMEVKTVSEIKDFVTNYLELHKINSLDSQVPGQDIRSSTSISASQEFESDVPFTAAKNVAGEGSINNRKTLKTDTVPVLEKIDNYAFADCPGIDYHAIKEKAIQGGINAFEDVVEDFISSEPDSSIYKAEDDVFVESKKSDSEQVLFDGAANGSTSVKDEFQHENKTENNALVTDVHSGESEYIEDNPDHDNLTTEDDKQHTEYLVDGFTVKEDQILCLASGESVKDVPIAALGLSVRASNCLNRTKEKIASQSHTEIMVSDVLCLSLEQLKNIRNMGAKSAEEVLEKVRAYLLDGAGVEDNGSTAGTSIAPGYSVIDGNITELETGLLVADVSVEYLDLGVRATNSLRSGGVHYLSDLIQITPQQLVSFSNMGAKTVSEIKDFVPTYLESHKVDSLDVKVPEYEIPSTISISALPELDPEIPVLASEYAVVDGVICNRKTFKVVQDVPVTILDLSVRSLNCLMRNGNKTIASLIGMPFSSFRQIRNLGITSANEIQDKLERYLDRKQEVSVQQSIPDKTVSETAVLSCLRENEFEAISYTDILEMLPDAEESNLLEVLGKLADSGRILFDGNAYSLYHRSFYELIQSLDNTSGLDERAIRILQMRVAGSTLEEVGQLEGTTRERIRQIEKKSLDRITRRGNILFDEDRYAYVFRTYSLEKEFYFDYLDGTADLWYYLNFRYTRGRRDPATALDDKLIAASVRRAIDKYIHRGYIQIDGEYILKQRGDIEDYVVERYCKDEVTLDQFFEYYTQFLVDNDLMNEKLEVTEAVRVSRYNRLSESMKLLWKQNQRLRYYDIEGTDYTELFETLNLGQYQNIELSTRKFLVDYPDLMERYDLRDEYEVHNLLKKIHAEKENPDMEFGRMPNIHFGVFDRDSAVKEILFALAPVSMDDLAEMISLEYGTQPATVKANWLTCISEYYHQGLYSVDYEDMPEEHMSKLKEALTDDFYFLSELRKIYAKTVPDADFNLLSTYNLKRMGFLVGASYVIQHYSTAEAYFDYLLTSSDVVDLMPINKRYTGLTTYSAYLARLKHDMQIIEFEPFQYINIHRLEKLGFGKDRLKEYGDRVWSFLVDDDFFTIQSLRQSGFEDELDSLGFGDMFYSSLLKEDGRFSWQRVGNNVVLNPKGSQFTVHDFLVDRITKEKAVDVDDFVHDLSTIYGISFNRREIIEKVKGSDVYYDSIMEKLYADYSTYFEEI